MEEVEDMDVAVVDFSLVKLNLKLVIKCHPRQ